MNDCKRLHYLDGKPWPHSAPRSIYVRRTSEQPVKGRNHEQRKRVKQKGWPRTGPLCFWCVLDGLASWEVSAARVVDDEIVIDDARRVRALMLRNTVWNGGDDRHHTPPVDKTHDEWMHARGFVEARDRFAASIDVEDDPRMTWGALVARALVKSRGGDMNNGGWGVTADAFVGHTSLEVWRTLARTIDGSDVDNLATLSDLIVQYGTAMVGMQAALTQSLLDVPLPVESAPPQTTVVRRPIQIVRAVASAEPGDDGVTLGQTTRPVTITHGGSPLPSHVHAVADVSGMMEGMQVGIDLAKNGGESTFTVTNVTPTHWIMSETSRQRIIAAELARDTAEQARVQRAIDAARRNGPVRLVMPPSMLDDFMLEGARNGQIRYTNERAKDASYLGTPVTIDPNMPDGQIDIMQEMDRMGAEAGRALARMLAPVCDACGGSGLDPMSYDGFACRTCGGSGAP